MQNFPGVLPLHPAGWLTVSPRLPADYSLAALARHQAPQAPPKIFKPATPLDPGLKSTRRIAGLGKEWKCPLKHSHHGSCNHMPNMNQALGIQLLFYQLINFIKNIIPYGKKFSQKIFSPPTVDKMLTFAGKKLSRLRKVCLFFFCENFLPRKFLSIIFITQ